jgi:hypothetical protein
MGVNKLNDIVEMITCKRCSQVKPPHKTSRHLCDDCVKAEDSRVSFFRQHNASWIEAAKDAELDLWERQPGETDHEYSVWLRYRDAYPGKRPSYKDVAEELSTSINAVRKIGGRWSFPARLQAWAKHVDEITLAQRHQEILGMNQTHISMAQKLNEKLQKAIDLLDPYALSPKDLNSLFKTAAELERKARLDQPTTPVVIAEDDNPNLKKMNVKSENISEILGILGKAGVLSNFGVKQTVTTEVVVRDDD